MIHIAGRDTYNAIWTRECFVGVNPTCPAWVYRAGSTTGKPSMAVDAAGRVYVAVRDPWGAAWMLRVAGEQATWHYGAGNFASLAIAADPFHWNVRVAGLDPWNALYTAEFGIGDSGGWGGWGGWDIRTGTLAAISAAQVNGWFYVYAKNPWDVGYRSSLETEVRDAVGAVAMGQPAATQYRMTQ